MKTVFVNGSPKKRFCASAYFLFLQRLFVGGKKVTLKLRTPADHEPILEELDDAQAVVFALPLYVDGIPSHVLRFLERMEAYCREKGLHLAVYCIANNGFIEGKQNEPLMQQFENFCARAGLVWGGGVGIGGGVMLNVTRIVFEVQIGLLLLNILLRTPCTCCSSTRACWRTLSVWAISSAKAPAPERSTPASWSPHLSSSCSRTSSLSSSLS